jgi:hypothetical protein
MPEPLDDRPPHSFGDGDVDEARARTGRVVF